jgi:hypothetical protein
MWDSATDHFAEVVVSKSRGCVIAWKRLIVLAGVDQNVQVSVEFDA